MTYQFRLIFLAVHDERVIHLHKCNAINVRDFSGPTVIGEDETAWVIKVKFPISELEGQFLRLSVEPMAQ